MEDIKRLGSIVNRKQLEQNDIITTFKVYILAFSAVNPFLRVVQTQTILFLKSMSERVGSDMDRL